jgi:hypothetical protein
MREKAKDLIETFELFELHPTTVKLCAAIVAEELIKLEDEWLIQVGSKEQNRYLSLRNEISNL